jgi:hypothetical protein
LNTKVPQTIVFDLLFLILPLFFRRSEGIVRTVVTLFLGIIGYGYGRWFALDHRFPEWPILALMVVLGLGLQITYARIVNRRLEALGLSESERSMLPNDKGLVPFWVAALGIAARACLLGGIVMPSLVSTGCLKWGT